MYSYYKTRHFALNLLLMITILLMKFNYYEFNTSVNQRYYSSYGQSGNSTNSLRFRDFEPRYTLKAETVTATATEIITLPRHSKVSPLNKRKSRGFQFHADDKDVSIEMEFIVPFVRIPIERSMDMTKAAFRNLLNLNIHSLLTTGAVVAVGGILAIIFKLLFSPFAGLNGFGKTSRDVDENFPYFFDYDNSTKPPVAKNFIGFVESKLEEYNIDLGKCVQRLICDYAQRSNKEVRSGTAGSLYKIIDGILSLKAVHKAMKGTAVQEAVETAKNDSDCSSSYGECMWNASTQNMIKTALKLLKYLHFI